METVRIASKKITTPIRIVQLSDLHSDPVPRAETRVVETVRALNPDLIVFTGDGVNSDEGIPVFRKTMRALADIAPLYGVRGNWEVWWFTHVDTFADTGIIELDNDAVPVTIKGQRLWLAGTAVDNEHKMKQTLAQLPASRFSVVLHHYPAAAELVDGHADLLLTGDTHGGQIRIPILGPLVRISRWNKAYRLPGLHTAPKGLKYYVNRGIGMEGGSVPRVRFNCAPEITLFELHHP